MKKISFFLMALLFSAMSFAETYTHTFKSGELKVGTVTLSGVAWTGAGTVEYWGWDSNNGKGIQIGSSGKPCTSYSLTTSAFAGTITEVVVNTSIASSGTAKLSVSVGGTSYLANKSLTTTATNYTATGAASGDLVISFTNTAKAFYIKSISVTYELGEEDPDATKYTVTTNVNDGTMGTVTGAGEYAEGTTVTLTAAANPGYKFVNWSNGETANPLKLTVTENVEITANFAAIPPMTCAEASAAAKDEVVVLNPFDVVYVVKDAGYIYIKDESGVALIFDYTLDDQLKAGDHVEGFVGVSSPYNGLPELKPSVSFTDLKVTPGTASEPTVMAVAPTQAELNQYVKFENVTLSADATFTTASATNATMVVNGTNVVLRNSFKLAATLSKDKVYNIVGFVAIYNSTIQVYYLSSEEVIQPETITKSYDLTTEAVSNRMGRQTISAEDDELGNVQLIIAGFDATVAEYAEASLSVGEETFVAAATYTNDAENNKDIYTAKATSTDGTKIYDITFNVALPTVESHILMSIDTKVKLMDIEGVSVYVFSGTAVMDTEDNIVTFELMVEEPTGEEPVYAEGMIGETFVLGTAEMFVDTFFGEIGGTAVLADENGNTYNFDFNAPLPQPEVEITVAETIELTGYKLAFEMQGNMAIVTADVEGKELFFWLTMYTDDNGYGTYFNESITNVWFGEDSLTPYGDEHIYSAENLKVSFINDPDAEGNVTLYNFTLIPGEKPATPAALENIDATVAPVKVVENGQLIIIKNNVKFNAQGAIVK